jgi:hypothetical protein
MSASAKVRMYRLRELGDCFLLTFTAGDQKSHMLIDCGSFRNSPASIARLKEVAEDIKEELAGKALDVVVGTHQHNDHLSGFVHCETEFRKIGVEQVWLSWLDNPQDRMATGIGERHNNLKLALHAGGERLRKLTLGSKGVRALEILDDMMGFYGVAAAKGKKLPPVLPADAVKILKSLGRKTPPLYLRPGKVIDVPGLPPGTIRAYVLGPPRKSTLLYRKDPHTGESYDHALAAANFSAARFLNALTNQAGIASSDEDQYPFSERYKRRGQGRSGALRKLQNDYNRHEGQWRRIDDDWTSQAESLALYLDTFTNNSSLVLAIELVDSRKVLLFAADAQTGNWLSWPDIAWERPGITTDDLLARTALYKVGHHASHNATLVAALEKMRHPDLAALIPVDKQDPNITKQNGWRMPAQNLFNRLAEKTSSRILQMDNVNPARTDLKSKSVIASWNRIGVEPKITPMYVEVEIGRRGSDTGTSAA